MTEIDLPRRLNGMETNKSARENELLSIRKEEVKRITSTMSPFLSYDNENMLYSQLAHLTKCAFMLGQFPDSPYLQEGRNSLRAKAKDALMFVGDKDRYEFIKEMRTLTCVDADEALEKIYILLQMIDADQEQLKLNLIGDIRALLNTSVLHGNEIPAKTKEPRWEINGVSTW